MLRYSERRGFVRAVVIVVVALVILKYFFDVSPSDIIYSEIAQDLWSILKSVCLTLWDLLLVALEYLKDLLKVAKTSVESLKK